tara:strand:+ start:556 stop:822 length:267 start_codon:yes stop_codon:yes gene_type:complete
MLSRSIIVDNYLIAIPEFVYLLLESDFFLLGNPIQANSVSDLGHRGNSFLASFYNLKEVLPSIAGKGSNPFITLRLKNGICELGCENI